MRRDLDCNFSSTSPPKPWRLQRPSFNGPFFPIPRGKFSGITFSKTRALASISGAICASPLIECSTWGSAVWIYTQAYDAGQTMLLPTVISGLSGMKREREGSSDRDSTDIDPNLESSSKRPRRASDASDVREDEGSDTGDDASCHVVRLGGDVENDEEGSDMEGITEVVVYGPPALHQQSIIVTDDCVDCLCGCRRTVKDIQVEKKARKEQSRAATVAATVAAAVDAAEAAVKAAHKTPIRILIAPEIHLSSDTPTRITIAPILHDASGIISVSPVIHFSPSQAPIPIDPPSRSPSPAIAPVPIADTNAPHPTVPGVAPPRVIALAHALAQNVVLDTDVKPDPDVNPDIPRYIKRDNEWPTSTKSEDGWSPDPTPEVILEGPVYWDQRWVKPSTF